jgi:hypothetical protein
VTDEPRRKQSLTLLPGKGITLEQLLGLFRHLTGREPTPEDAATARRILNARRAPPEPTQHASPGG